MGIKKYSISELASILDVSIVAIRKKIKGEGSKKRYKERFEVISEDNKMFILLDDADLLEEQELAKMNKNKFASQQNVSSNVTGNAQNVEIIDVNPEIQQMNDFSNIQNENLTERYIKRLENLYETLDETRQNALENEKKIFLLEDIEKRKDVDLSELRATNKTLSITNKRYLITLITLLITFIITLSITFVYFISHPKTITQEKQVTKVITVENGKIKSILTEKGK